jgi:2-methylcitrate dehydratase PrpD
MNKIAGAILILAAAVSGHGVMVFLASHPQIHRYDIPAAVSNMVLVGIATAAVLGCWGMLHLIRKDLP